MGWLSQSFLAVIGTIPIMMALPFLGRHFGVRHEAFVLLYFLGVFIGSMLWLLLGKAQPNELLPALPIVLVILCIGIFLGTPMNFLFFDAIAKAPNPAFPLAILNSGSIWIFILSVVFALKFPKWFTAVQGNWVHLIGIILIVIGIALISFKK